MKSSKSSPEPRMANGLKPIQVVLSKPVLPSFYTSMGRTVHQNYY